MLPMDTIPVLEELSSLRRNKKSLKIGDGSETRDRARRAADFVTKEQESEGKEIVLGMLLKLPHIYFPIHSYLSFHCPREIGFNDA